MLSHAERYARAKANCEAATNGTLNIDIHSAVAGLEKQTRLAVLYNVLGSTPRTPGVEAVDIRPSSNSHQAGVGADYRGMVPNMVTSSPDVPPVRLDRTTGFSSLLAVAKSSDGIQAPTSWDPEKETAVGLDSKGRLNPALINIPRRVQSDNAAAVAAAYTRAEPQRREGVVHQDTADERIVDIIMDGINHDPSKSPIMTPDA